MAYSPAEQEANAAAVKTVLWARLSVNHTKKTCAISILVPLIALAIVIFAASFSIDDPSERDFLVRNDIRSIRQDGRIAARDQFPYTGEGASTEDNFVSRGEPSFKYDLALLFRGRVGRHGPVGVFNDTDAQAANVLTREGLALMKKAEDDLFSDPRLKNFCLNDPAARDCNNQPLPCKLPESVLMNENLYGEWTGEGEDRRLCGRTNGHQLVSEQAFNAFLDSLFLRDDQGKITAVDPFFSPYIGIDFSQENQQTWVAHSYFPIGIPFEGFSTTDDDSEEQARAYDDWASDAATRAEQFTAPDIDVFLVSNALINGAFNSIVLRDLSFSIAAMVMVFLVIWLHTTSAFLALSSMAQIFLAFPFAYFFYNVIFRQKYFAALQILVVFLILGIGADDVFVFTDAWKQSAVVLGSQCDLVTRMSWTYTRAVKAMSVTSVTTAAAFLVTASSPIMPIGTLGVWAGTLVILQFVLVITVYPCSVIIWHRFWRIRPILNCWRRIDKTETPYVPFWHRCLPQKLRPAAKESNVEEYRLVERFFRNPWITFVNRFRFILLFIAVALAAVCLYFATKLQPPSEEEDFLPKSHPLRVAVDTLDNAFPRSEAALQLQVRVTWGIVGTDRTGTSKFDPSNPGKAVLDEDFDLRTAEAQGHLLRACEFFGTQNNLIFQEPTIPKDNIVQCWIEKYRDWRVNNGRTEFQDYEEEADLITDIISFGNEENENGEKPNLRYLTDQHVAFNKELNSIVFSEVRFLAPVDSILPYKLMFPLYEEWERQLEIFNSRTPSSIQDKVGNAFATAGASWTYMITQRTLVRTMFVGIGVMVAVAFAALTVSTLNWAIAIITTIAIGGIVVMLLGLIKLYGWQLGITESVGVVIAIGYSFDGAAHIATAYVESKSVERFARTRDALTDLGISVLFGALTTFLAGLMLFPAIIIFFVKFAGLLVTTIVLSLLWSLIFLPALLLVIGPVGDFGSLKALYQKLRGRGRRKQVPKSSEGLQVDKKDNFVDEAQLEPSGEPTSNTVSVSHGNTGNSAYSE